MSHCGIRIYNGYWMIDMNIKMKFRQGIFWFCVRRRQKKQPAVVYSAGCPLKKRVILKIKGSFPYFYPPQLNQHSDLLFLKLAQSSGNFVICARKQKEEISTFRFNLRIHHDIITRGFLH